MTFIVKSIGIKEIYIIKYIYTPRNETNRHNVHAVHETLA